MSNHRLFSWRRRRNARVFTYLFVLVVCGCLSGTTLASAPPSWTVVFGGDHAYPPFEWDDNGTPVGFLIDLKEAIGKTGKAKITHRLGDWPDVIRALDAGEIDVVPMFASNEREKKYLFTRAFHFMAHAIYTRQGEHKVQVIKDLEGSRVAVERSSYAHEKFTSDNLNVRLILTANTLEALRAVTENKAEFAVLSIPAADRLIRNNDLTARKIGPPFWPRGYVFAVKKDRVDLAEWLDESLSLVIGTGLYEDIYHRWEDSLAPTDLTFKKAMKTSAFIIGPMVLLIALGFGWSLSLRHTVAARTFQLREELQRRERAEVQLQHAANHDTETGLPKYHHLIELLDDILGRARTETGEAKEVVVLKLMEMDSIVRTFGYSIARIVVKEFAERLDAMGFDVTAYFGRGVFSAVGNKNSVTSALEDVTGQLDAGGLGLYPQVIGGIGHWPDHAKNASELIRRAETALAAGITRGRHWTVYHPSMEPDQDDLKIVTAFRKSNADGLYAVLQPQIDVDSGQIVAAEALVRWDHPSLGFVSPGKFIPLLEKAGLVSLVTAKMIDIAAGVATRLRHRGMCCTISINVSANDLLQTELPEVIFAALDRHGAKPSDIKLELTETSVAEDPVQVRAVLEELNRAGIYASIDDFGTGYSSLSYLSEFPICELKVDQTFVRDMVTNARNHSIVRSTIAMAHELDLLVVAEGAEDQETFKALKQVGCDRVQGYVISKPLLEDEFHTFLKRFHISDMGK